MGDVYLPILKDTKDPHYRYKMPKLTAKIEGSGNGIKTVLTNMTAVARALGRPPSYPTKYFGCELGAQVTMATDSFIVNGSHDPEKLLNLLYTFIRRFVLCTKCNNPETTLTIVKQNIMQKCIACGHETTIPKTIHKLTTFIVNHPPDGSEPAKSSKKAQKESKKSSKKGGQSSPTNNDTNQSSSHADLNDDFGANGDEDDDFGEDEFTADALTERIKDLHSDFSGGKYMSSSKESANLFYNMVKEKKEAGVLHEASVQKELVKEAEKLEFKDKATLILCELLFSDENILDEIKQHRLLFLRFCHENRKAQKYLLGGFEKLVGDVYQEKLFANATKILKQLYDEDILEEEAILEWAAKESKKYVGKEMSKKIHEKVAPFVKWLKEAEVDDDDDDDDEDDDDDDDEDDEDEDDEDQDEEDEKPAVVVKSNGKKVVENGTKKAATQSAGNNNNKVQEEDDEDDGLIDFSHRVQGIQIEEVSKKDAVKVAVNADIKANSNAEDTNVEDLDIDNI